MESILAEHTHRSVEQVHDDIERDRVLTADEAKDYGIVDEIITSRKLSLVR
jgi:ATP-dependent Clp protease, protease subunit